jgi:signal transduction histidine kinase
MGFAAVARVTEDRWIACGVRDEIAFGLKPGGELKIETTICNEIRQHREAVVIDSVADDPLYAHHHTPALYGLQSYISMPIMLPDGSFFGTLCAIDRVARKLNTVEIIGMFKLFADLIAFHLDANQRLLTSESDLKIERQGTEIREQFIAVLGHDLRNPLASVDAGLKMIRRTPLDQKAISIVDLMQSSVQRMAVLIDDVMDFARGRLGSGLTIEKAAHVELRPMLEQVVEEIRIAHPDREIESSLDDVSVRCDPGRIGQLLSNLLINALMHGTPEGAIRVESMMEGDVYELSVSNQGAPIPQDVRANLFKPFFRASHKQRREGLGLGLYIASEIARAHGGSLSLTSSEEETRFVFRLQP